MSQLPNADQAVVPELKIKRYLLDLTSKHGKAKAVFFMGFGFTLAEWETLAAALKQHAATHEVASIRTTAYGVNYTVEGALVTPDDRNPQVRSVWKIDTGATFPSLVTAYPLDPKDEEQT